MQMVHSGMDSTSSMMARPTRMKMEVMAACD